MTCPKCPAGRANLHSFTEYLGGGEILQTVRCLLCSTRQSRVVLAANYRGQNEQAFSDGKTPAERTEQSARISAARRKAVVARSKTCAVLGCDGTYYAASSRRPLCKSHRNRLDAWDRKHRNGHMGAAPVLLVNGQWVERGQPVPLDPPPVDSPISAKAAAVPAPKRPTRATRGVWIARCSGCRRKTAIAAWNLCQSCLDQQRKEACHG